MTTGIMIERIANSLKIDENNQSRMTIIAIDWKF